MHISLTRWCPYPHSSEAGHQLERSSILQIWNSHFVLNYFGLPASQIYPNNSSSLKIIRSTFCCFYWWRFCYQLMNVLGITYIYTLSSLKPSVLSLWWHMVDKVYVHTCCHGARLSWSMYSNPRSWWIAIVYQEKCNWTLASEEIFQKYKCTCTSLWFTMK